MGRVLPFVMLLALVVLEARGGSCEAEFDEYLTQLERKHYRPLPGESDGPLDCLTGALNFYELGRDDFAVPDRLAEIRAKFDPWSERAAKVLPQYLAKKETACQAATALALFRGPGAYEALSKHCRDDVFKALAFGILGDSRAVPWIVAQYRRVDVSHRRSPRRDDPYRLDYLNALYLLAAKGSLPFLEETIRSSRSPAAIARARLVKARILDSK